MITRIALFVFAIIFTVPQILLAAEQRVQCSVLAGKESMDFIFVLKEPPTFQRMSVEGSMLPLRGQMPRVVSSLSEVLSASQLQSYLIEKKLTFGPHPADVNILREQDGEQLIDHAFLRGNYRVNLPSNEEYRRIAIELAGTVNSPFDPKNLFNQAKREFKGPVMIQTTLWDQNLTIVGTRTKLGTMTCTNIIQDLDI